jgi:hypothetical protein
VPKIAAAVAPFADLVKVLYEEAPRQLAGPLPVRELEVANGVDVG